MSHSNEEEGSILSRIMKLRRNRVRGFQVGKLFLTEKELSCIDKLVEINMGEIFYDKKNRLYLKDEIVSKQYGPVHISQDKQFILNNTRYKMLHLSYNETQRPFDDYKEFSDFVRNNEYFIKRNSGTKIRSRFLLVEESIKKDCIKAVEQIIKKMSDAEISTINDIKASIKEEMDKNKQDGSKCDLADLSS